MDPTLREQVLRVFTKADGELSGQQISESLGCTRTAVWKQIETLRQLGYTFTAKPRRGYKLIRRPDVVVPEEIRCFNQSTVIGQVIRYTDAASSTQLMAHEWAQNGAPHGGLVIADAQTEGRGRLGRQWHSPPGSGVWMSLILRPEIPLSHTPHLTLLLSVAVTRALRREVGVDAWIKWPNDVLISGRKVCGILIEVGAEADQIHYCIAGIGLNVHADDAWPEAIGSIATALSLHAIRPLHRAEIIAACCQEIESLLELYHSEGFSPIRSLWEALTLMIGHPITVHTAQGVRSGTAIGLADDGALLLETETGVERVFSADVTIG